MSSAGRACRELILSPFLSPKCISGNMNVSLKPSWTMHIQVMTFAEAEKFRWNPFDLTKVNHNFYDVNFVLKNVIMKS